MTDNTRDPNKHLVSTEETHAPHRAPSTEQADPRGSWHPRRHVARRLLVQRSRKLRHGINPVRELGSNWRWRGHANDRRRNVRRRRRPGDADDGLVGSGISDDGSIRSQYTRQPDPGGYPLERRLHRLVVDESDRSHSGRDSVGRGISHQRCECDAHELHADIGNAGGVCIHGDADRDPHSITQSTGKLPSS